MDCNEFKRELPSLFDADADKALAAELEVHLQTCPTCSADFYEMEEVVECLKPRYQPSAPVLLKQSIINHLSKEDETMKSKKTRIFRLNSTIKKVAAIAAVLVAVVIAIPLLHKGNQNLVGEAKAGNSLIESSIKATGLIKTMVMKLKVRTLPNDNFALIGTEYDMVEHTISKSFEKPEKWRLDKGGRVVVCDGKQQLMWIPMANGVYKGSLDAGFAEWFRILLNPESVLLKEQTGITDKTSEVSISEKDGEIHMTITSKAQGNFINDYCKNQSISESDNRREYVFSSQTKLIKSLKIYVLEGSKETLILETESIDYNVPLSPSTFALTLPKGAEVTDLAAIKTVKSETFSNISSKRAAEIIFDAMANNRWDAVKVPFAEYNFALMKLIKRKFSGLKVVKIGEPFKSGLFPGEFVPYEVVLSDGNTNKFNLALRNDNKNKVWLVSGGL
jgi:outer membrane lipoprotein-sorting protein